MTQPHPTAPELLAYAGRDLPAVELLAISDHLAACPACRERGRQPAPGRRGDLAVEAAPGVDYETLRDYLDGSLGSIDREILEADVRNHPEIAAQLEDLRRLQLADEREDVAKVIPLPPRHRPPAWLWAAAAAILIVGVSAWVTWPRGQHAGSGNRTLSSASISDLPVELQGAARQAMTTGWLPMPAVVQELRGGARTLLAEKAGQPRSAFLLVSPVGEVIRQTRPTLRWTALPGAVSYRVTVARRADGQLIRSPVLQAAETAWTLAEPLAPGEGYEWQVQALDAQGNVLARSPTPPQAEGRFQVLDAASAAELQKLEAATPPSNLALAMAYAKVGLLEEAQGAIRAVAADNPGSRLPARWLAQLRAAKGDYPPAANAPTVTNGAQ